MEPWDAAVEAAERAETARRNTREIGDDTLADLPEAGAELRAEPAPPMLCLASGDARATAT